VVSDLLERLRAAFADLDVIRQPRARRLPHLVALAAMLAAACGPSTGPPDDGPDPLPPSAPTDLHVVATSDSTVQLTWHDRSQDEAGFKLYRGTTSDAVTELVATTAADVESWADSGLTAGATYHYRGYAFNQAGQSQSYAGASIVMPAPPGIVLSQALVTFAAVPGEGDPAVQSASVTNAGWGSLGGLTIHVAYAAGEPADWLDATLASSTTPTSLDIGARLGSLLGGTYHAIVVVETDLGGIDPDTVTVTFTVPTRLLDRIVFAVSGPSDPGVFTIEPDGTGRERLFSGSTYANPDVSPDGMLVVVNWRDQGIDRLRVVDADFNVVRDLGDGIAGRWSPDGTQVLYAKQVDLVSAIWVVNKDGTGDQQLTVPPAGSFHLFADWSPDAAYITWSQGGDDESVWVMELSSGSAWRFSDGRYPSFARDQASILLSRGGAVVERRFDGSSEQVFPVWPQSLHYCPVMSPDGTTILTLNGQPWDLETQLVLMDADGGNQRLLFETPDGYVTCPRWTPASIP